MDPLMYSVGILHVTAVPLYQQHVDNTVSTGPQPNDTELELGKMTSLVVPHSRPSAKARSQWRVAAAAASGIVLLAGLSMVGTVFCCLICSCLIMI